MSTDMWDRACECRYRRGDSDMSHPRELRCDHRHELRSMEHREDGKRCSINMTKGADKTPLGPETWEIRQEHTCAHTG